MSDISHEALDWLESVIDRKIQKALLQNVKTQYKGRVLSKDADGVVWVEVPGIADRLPADISLVEVGNDDIVQVTIDNGAAIIDGNQTSPAVNATIVENVTVGIVAPIEQTLKTIAADQASFKVLQAEYANIVNATIQELVAGKADIDFANITFADIDQAFVNALNANYAHITNGTIDNATIGYADVDGLNANYAHITNGAIDNAKIGYADVNGLNANYAQINLANVNNAWIENGVVKDAAISDAKIIGVSANKLTAGTIDAGSINVTNLRTDNLIVSKLNGQPVFGGYEAVNSNASGYSSMNPSTQGWYEISNGQMVASTDTEVDPTKAYYTSSANSVQVYDQDYIDGVESTLNSRIDGTIESFTGSVVPTTQNYPYTDWYDTTTSPVTDTRDEHVGDIYYVVNAGGQSDGYCYRFAKSGTGSSATYSWVLIKDSDVTAALAYFGDMSTLSGDFTVASFATSTATDLSNVQTAVSTLRSDLGSHENFTSNTVAQRLYENEATITSLSTTVQHGGRNLWLDTYTFASFIMDNEYTKTAGAGVNGSTVISYDGTNTGSSRKFILLNGGIGGKTVPLVYSEDTKFTLSCYCRVLSGTITSDCSVFSRFQLPSGTTFPSTGLGYIDVSISLNLSSLGLTSDWKLIKATVTVPAATYASVSTQIGSRGTVGFDICLPKMEYGENATPWENSEGDITTMSNTVSSIVQDVSGITSRVGKVEAQYKGQFATCSTAAGTAAKAATITPTNNAWTMETGSTVTVKFTTANTTSSPTLNVNSKGAKSIRNYAGSTLSEAEYKWVAGSSMTFTYDGTYWRIQDSSTLTRLKSAETSITQNAENIELKVSESDVTGDYVVGKINLNSTTATIAAGRVDIEGAAIFTGSGRLSTTSLDSAYDAKGSAAAANSQEQLIYCSKASGTSSLSGTTTWVTDVTGGQNKWTAKRPQYSQSYPVLFVATQRKTVGGTVTCTTPMIDDTTTVIDGGNIITGSVTANQIDAASINIGSLGGAIGGANLLNENDAVATPESYKALEIYLSEPLVSGETYTLQLWDVNVSHTAKSAGDLGVWVYYCGGAVCLGGWKGTGYFTDGYAGRLQLTFTPHDSAVTESSGGSEVGLQNLSHSNVASAEVPFIRLYNSVPSVSGTMNLDVVRWKLEKGSRATDWSMSQADIGALIDAMGETKANASDVPTKMSQLENDAGYTDDSAVTELSESFEEFKTAFSVSDQGVQSIVAALKKAFSESQYTEFNQTSDTFEFNFTSLDTALDAIRQYITIRGDTMVLGRDDHPVCAELSSTGLAFYRIKPDKSVDYENPIASLEVRGTGSDAEGVLVIHRAVLVNELRLGNWALVPRSGNNNLSLKWIGG